MKNYKAYYIINALTEEELNLFESFLKSPYHNTRKKPIELFQIIKRNKNKSETSKQKAFEKLYPDKIFNSNTFNDLMAQLHRLAEEFLVVEKIRNSKIKTEITSLEIYLTDRFKGLFESKKRQIDMMLEKDEKIDAFFYWHSFLRDAFTAGYIQSYKKLYTQKDLYPMSEYLHHSVLNITSLYLQEILASYLQSITRKNTFRFSEFPDFIKNVADMLFQNDFLELFKSKNKHYEIIFLSGKNYKLINSEGDVKTYLDFKNSLIKFRNKLTHDQYSHFNNSLTNYCIRNIRSLNKNQFFINELYPLFEEINKHKYYKNPNIPFFRTKLYSNFLNFFVVEKNIEYIQRLINECAPLLDKTDVDYQINISRAFIFYLQENFSEALEIAHKLKPLHKEDVIRLKELIIKLHYHLGNTEQVFSLLDSLNKLLKVSYRSNGNIYTNKIYFSKNLKKIITLKDKKSLDEMNYLYEKIKNEEYRDTREWLLNILEKIIQEDR